MGNCTSWNSNDEEMRMKPFQFLNDGLNPDFVHPGTYKYSPYQTDLYYPSFSPHFDYAATGHAITYGSYQPRPVIEIDA